MPRPPWLLRVFKCVFYVVYLYSGYVPFRDFVLSLLGRSWLIVLNYHSIGGCDAVSKPLSAFRRDVMYLRNHCCCIGFPELCDRIRSGAPLRRRYRAITFDDGYRDNFTEAFPVLRDAGVLATFFVATGYVGVTRAFPYEVEVATASGGSAPLARPSLTWADLQVMQGAGYEIGSHTVNHINLGTVDADCVSRELAESLAALNQQLGDRPRPFAFPWGKPGFFSPAAMRAVEETGYYAAATAYGGVNRRGGDLFNVRRIDVGNGGLGWLETKARMSGFDPELWRRRLQEFLGRTPR